MVTAAILRAQQRGRFTLIHDQDVEVPIVIEVAEGAAAAGVGLENRRAA